MAESEQTTVSTAPQPRVIGKPFPPGNNANPAGRPKGSRNKLGEAFIQDLYADWQEHGADTIKKVRAEKPDAYLKVVASILPQRLEISHVDDMSDDERINRIREIADQLGAVVQLGIAAGIAGAVGGTAALGRPDEAQPIQTVQ